MSPYLLLPLFLLSSCTAWSGILNDGRYSGAQYYFPTTLPHSMGNVPLNLPHCDMGAAVMMNGKAYFIGGQWCNGQGENRMIVFDPTSNTTTMMNAQTPQADFLAATAVSGTILLCSQDEAVSTCYTYATSTQSWTRVADISTSMAYVRDFTLTTIGNSAYVFGGTPQNCDESRNFAYKFDVQFVNTTWTLFPVTAMPQATSGHATLTLDSDTALVCGGCTTASRAVQNCFVYTASTNSWKPVGSMATARTGASMVMLADRIYILGGRDSNGQDLSTVEVYSVAGGGHVLPYQMAKGGVLRSTVAISF
jgi:N-acetylneuraminic acid mutarotase